MIDLKGGIAGFPDVPDAISAARFHTGFMLEGETINHR